MKRLRYPIFEVKDIEQIKELRLKEFNIEGVDKHKLLKYIAACYDKNSELFNVTKIERRKAAAVSAAEFPKNADGLVPPYDDVATLTGAVGLLVGRAIITYCRLQNEEGLYQLFTYEEALLQQNELLLSTKDPKEMGNVIANINSLNKAIGEIRLSFLSGDTSKETKKALLDFILNESLGLTPEEVAMKDEIATYSPYGRYSGEEYTTEDLSDEEFNQLNKELTNDTEEARRHFSSLGLDANAIINENKEKWTLKR